MKNGPLNLLKVIALGLISCGLLLVILAGPLSLRADTKPAGYDEAVLAYQDQDFRGAAEKFRDVLGEFPNNTNVLFNLGLSELQLKRQEWSLALWRKALFLDPNFSAARKALSFVESSHAPPLWEAFDSWESFRAFFLVTFRLNQYLLMTALLLSFGGWLMVRYLGKRRRALNDESALPPFPSIAVIFCGLFLIGLSLSFLKFYDLQHVRATVVEKSVTVKTLPDEQSNAVFELSGGQEVILLNNKNDWTQVSYPGGMSGWVPNTALFKTYGTFE